MTNQVNTLSPAAAWHAALGELELQMTKATFNSWLKDASFISCQNNLYKIGVRSSYAKDWLENRMADTILRTLRAIAHPDAQIEFVVPGNEQPPDNDGSAELDAADGDSIATVWQDVMTDYAARQTAVQPRDCLRWLRKIEWLWVGTKLQVWCRDEGVLANLNRMDKDWVGGLQTSLSTLASADYLLEFIEPNTNGKSTSKKAPQRKKGAGGDDDSPVRYRNIRPPTDPLGSFVKASHYAIRFWRPFLGADVFDLLLIISSYAYEFKELHKEGPSLKVLIGKMGRRGDTRYLTGRSSSGKGDTRRDGQYGWLNELRDHNICHHNTTGTGKGTRHYFDYLTEMKDLPLLTPKQVATLSEDDQKEHEEWIRLHTAVDYNEWLADDRETRIPDLPLTEEP